MNEAFLQYVWQHKLIEGDLQTTDGRPLTVERPGELNRDAGPDFLNARVLIDGTVWAGNIEIHVHASDWTKHRHSDDRGYDNVILHVVLIYDQDISLPDGTVVPTLSLEKAIPEKVMSNYDKLMVAAAVSPIACASRLNEIPDFLLHLSQDRMIVERMESKSAHVSRLLSESKGNWELTCYWLVAHYFGGKTNAYPFELLAKSVPMNVVAKIKDNPMRVEALFMGQAGLLDQTFSDDYALSLQKEYHYLRMAYNLRPLAPHLWKFFRLRPSSFPTIRISQFASLLVQSKSLFSKLLDADDVKTLRSLFQVSASPYWDSHYQFEKTVQSTPKRVGKDFVDSLIINAWIPLLMEFGKQHDRADLKERSFQLLQQLPPENNSIVRLWTAEQIVPHNAAESQALIQRFNEYCKDKKCLDCQLAFRLIKF